ncbi:MAG: hypothetical protein M3397_03315, partial [Actinomycetota bacterium]|nr:hypothetical protein [Actinomycetota bacterium]
PVCLGESVVGIEDTLHDDLLHCGAVHVLPPFGRRCQLLALSFQLSAFWFCSAQLCDYEVLGLF